MDSEEFLFTLMADIAARTREHEREIREMNLAIFKQACYFDTYEDLYRFVRRACPDNAEFNSAMRYCRENFLSNRKGTP